MRFTFTEEQRLFQRAVREVLEKECTPESIRAATAERSGAWRGISQLGVCGVTAPKAYGGLGLDELDLILLLEETGRACLPDPIVEHAAVAIPLLRDLGAGAEWLGRLSSGEALATVALEGRAVGAGGAQIVLSLGAEIRMIEGPTGTLRESIDSSRRSFAVETDAGEVLAADDPARDAGERARDRGALGTAAQLVGAGTRAIELAAAYAKDRHQFGRPIGSFQAVKHLLADALLGIEMARPAVYRAAFSVARDGPQRNRDVSLAKVVAGDAATRAVRAALQVHGAIGYTQEADLHLWIKRAWALAGAWGDTEWHRARLDRMILG